MTGPTVRLLRALLPPTWPRRRDLLDAAARIDLAHGPGAEAVLLFALTEHRATGALPADHGVREACVALVELLAGARTGAAADGHGSPPDSRGADPGRRQRDEPTTGLDADLDRFVARLVAGAETYGDRSFTRPAVELVDEIQQELEDVCGWSLLLWIRLDRLRGAVERLDGKESNDG